MKIEIYLRFTTRPGQSLRILGNIKELGNGQASHSIPLAYVNQYFWKVSLSISSQSLTGLTGLNYSFIYQDEHGDQIQDWGIHRNFHINNASDDLLIVDTWNDMGVVDNTFYTSPFTNVFINKTNHVESIPSLNMPIRFTTVAPLLNSGESICLIGNHKALGEWIPQNAIVMKFDGQSWFHDIAISGSLSALEYKYGVADKDGRLIRFEDGLNRTLRSIPTTEAKIVVNDGYARFNTSFWKGTGIAIPVFSLRSTNGLGVGEFLDIKLLVDWAKKVSIKMLQLLPVNDTTSTHTFLDSYPYAAISAFALHPLYANLEAIAGPTDIKLIKTLLQKKEALNAKSFVDYDEVMNIKWEALRLLFNTQHVDVLSTKEYKEFFTQNKYWLVPYAVFSYLRELNQSADPATWGEYATFNESLINEITKPNHKDYKDISFYYYIQYQLHCQLKEAHDYATHAGILLKGDIPIGVHRNGVDAWMQPSLYHLDMQAGAPPDDFAITGQNWGFPTYNWKVMQQDGYAWWQKRFKQMSNYYDAFRIDHILGFFRIWSIPSHAVEGIMGHFVPAIPVSREEIENLGITFNVTRFCSPFITDTLIHQLAGDHVSEIQHFLNASEGGIYQFKPAFDTQRKIEQYFNSIDDQNSTHHIKRILFNIHSNVILWKDDEQKDMFHFRFNAPETFSFSALNDYEKHQLAELYIDYFFKRQDHIWRVEAMQKLPALKKSTDMLICGEDLGLVPGCLPKVMTSLGFLSLEVQRMPKQLNVSFFNPSDAPYLSVVTPSTHDMSTLREWWEEDSTRSQQFYNEQLGQYGSAPYFAEPDLIRAIILQHLWSPAMWSVFQLQDLFAMRKELRIENPREERINVPGDSKHFWKFRMHVPIEELLSNDEFNAELDSYIKMSGRS